MKKFLLVLFLMFTVPAQAADPIKPPNVAGGFYPADPAVLAKTIDDLMALAPEIAADHPIAIAIAPHAGYQYSGPVAAHIFKALSKQKYTTIIILAPSHYYPFDGAAIWPKGGLQTPLGVVPVDEDLSQILLKETAVVQDLPTVFNQEHALEVELPFIQRTFAGAKVVPLILGQPDFKKCEQLAIALNRTIGAREDILVLLSSDMAHYHPYDENDMIDAGTLDALTHQDIERFWDGNVNRTMEMCGFVPTTVGLMLARLRGLSATVVLKHANSGDATGDRTSVVGYGAILFDKADAGLGPGQKKYLVALARQSLEAFVRSGKKIDVAAKDQRLAQVQGAFVTINKNGQLRGCIGNIIGQGPLAVTVRDMAIAAASQDPRFPPVSVEELKDLEVEVSVLSTPKRVRDASGIVLGRDGVIISDGGLHQGVFLPQVAEETGWSKEEFLSELCAQKAGLPPDAWKDPKMQLYTFTAEVIHEE